MKKIILLLVFLAIAPLSSAQEIIYNFKTGKFTKGVDGDKVQTVRNGRLLVVTIDDINTFRYQVAVNGKNVEYVTEMPSELQTIFRQNATAATPITDNVGEVEEQTNLMEKQENKVSSFNKAAAKGKLPDFEKAMDDLVKSCKNYLAAVKKVSKLELRRIELINLCKDNRNKFTEPAGSKTRAELIAIYDEFIDTYADAIVKYKVAKNISETTAAKAQLISDDVVEEAYEEIEEAHQKIVNANVLGLIEDLLRLQNAIADPNTFKVITAPIQVDGGDYIGLSVTTTPTPVTGFAPFDSEKTFNIEVPVKGGLKIDFSVGPVFSLGDNAKDDKYFLEAGETPDTSILRKRDNDNVISPGLAAMMHFYPKAWINDQTSFGGLFGVGAGFQSMDDVDLSFYFGASLVMGKRQKLMLNAGISFLRVDRLKEGEYDEGEEYPTADIDLGSVTEKVFKGSFFVSLSYNLTSRTER